MNTLTKKAYAKINLCLHIPAIRKDGYHELDSVFQRIGLFDCIKLSPAEGIAISCDKPDIPIDETNTCYIAAKMMMAATGAPGVSVAIEKHIPDKAGLGGGSADAASVILGMNEMCGNRLSPEEMSKIAVTIGADVPFFIQGGCMRARGIGEKLTPLINPFSHEVVIIKPKGGVSTPECYRLFDLLGKTGGGAENMIAAMETKDERAYFAAVYNALQPAAFRLAQKSEKAVDALVHLGAGAAQVTGSGSAVFGLFSRGEGKRAKEKLETMGFEQVFLTGIKNESVDF